MFGGWVFALIVIGLNLHARRGGRSVMQVVNVTPLSGLKFEASLQQE